MADERERRRWRQTAEVLAMLFNAHRGPRQKPLAAGDFNPTLRRKSARKTPLTEAEKAAMRQGFAAAFGRKAKMKTEKGTRHEPDGKSEVVRR